MAALSPTAPAPNTTTESEALGFSTLRTPPAPVCTPHAMGEATSHGRSSGRRTTFASRARAWVAQEDWPR